MILTKNYVLVNEIANQHKVKISNFSPLGNDERLIESEAVVKSSGTMVIDRTSNDLPQYIKDLVLNTNHTDLSGLFIMNELKDEFYLTSSQIDKIGLVIDIEKKKFVRINDDFNYIFENPKLVIYPIDKSEIGDASMKDIIDKKQFKQIDKNTFLTWY
jgi:hypothetical protein